MLSKRCLMACEKWTVHKFADDEINQKGSCVVLVILSTIHHHYYKSGEIVFNNTKSQIVSIVQYTVQELCNGWPYSNGYRPSKIFKHPSTWKIMVAEAINVWKKKTGSESRFLNIYHCCKFFVATCFSQSHGFMSIIELKAVHRTRG